MNNTRETEPAAPEGSGETIEISIADCGTSSTLTIAPDGTLSVLREGGCPVADILAGVRWTDDLRALCARVMALWIRGYDGCPTCSGLWVGAETDHDSACLHSHDHPGTCEE